MNGHLVGPGTLNMYELNHEKNGIIPIKFNFKDIFSSPEPKAHR